MVGLREGGGKRERKRRETERDVWDLLMYVDEETIRDFKRFTWGIFNAILEKERRGQQLGEEGIKCVGHGNVLWVSKNFFNSYLSRDFTKCHIIVPIGSVWWDL